MVDEREDGGGARGGRGAGKNEEAAETVDDRVHGLFVRVERLERAVTSLEKVAKPMLYRPSLADKIREGWSAGRRLVGITTPPDGCGESEPRWGMPTHATGALVRAALDFDTIQDRLVALLSERPEPDGTDPRESELVATLRDVIVSLGDSSVACHVAAREVA